MHFNVDELLIYFIEISYNDNIKSELYTSLALLDMFGLKYYDSELVSILMNDDLVDSNELKDFVYNNIQSRIIDIIKSHEIHLNFSSNITLKELNEIANFLYLIQNIENYEYVSYILSSSRYTEDDNRRVLVNLIGYFSTLNETRLIELIERVEDGFLDRLQEFVEYRTEKINDRVNINYLKNINYFFEFIDNTDCLGKQLFEKGYINSNLMDIVKLSNIDFETIEKENELNLPMLTLHYLSLLMIAKDSYENPGLFFNKYLDLFLQNKEKALVINDIMKKMLLDFNDFAKAKEKGFSLVEEKRKDNEET